MRATKIAAAVALALAAGSAVAVQKPVAAPGDKRIQSVAYDPENVIHLPLADGVLTHIVLAPGESLVGAPKAGDSSAVEAVPEANHLWLKPRATNVQGAQGQQRIVPPSDTNLSFVTTAGRSYNFHLEYTRSASRAVYQLTILYPEDEARALRERAMAAATAEQLAQPAAAENHAYSLTRDEGIEVEDVWDDGVLTHFRFRGEVPVIEALDAAGEPYVVARTMRAPDHAVVHGVARRWILRLGKEVVRGVVNEAYDAGRAGTPTGTVSPGVQRVLRDGGRE